jgi:tRNA(Ile)-lysidine synthase
MQARRSRLGYHFPVDSLPTALLKTIRKNGLIRAGDRVGAAVSGGADSMALLMLLIELRSELGFVLSVVHVNHKLRGRESDDDEAFVLEASREYGLECHVQACPLENAQSGMEATARRLRYEFFERLLADGRLAKIATGHTLDDQAETVLLRMLRGTGIRGLAGIHPRLIFKGGEVVRPLLGTRRSKVEAFLRKRGQVWREDSSNCNLAILRNRVRHRILPLINEELGPAVFGNLADLAEIARAEEEHWATEQPVLRSGECANLSLRSLAVLSMAAQRRLIRSWLEGNSAAVSFRWIELVRELALGPSGKTLVLTGAQQARRTQQELLIETVQVVPDYEYRLTIPGRVEIAELGMYVEAVLMNRADIPQEAHGELLDPAKLSGELVIRNWRAGDRFWSAHSKSPKKIKDLLNDRHMTGAAKSTWPVATTSEGSVVWVRGFYAAHDFQAAASGQVLWIRTSTKLNKEP